MKYDYSVMCRFYCIAFIEDMFPGKNFFPSDYKKNNEIIYKYFTNKYGKENADLEFRLKQ